jgi:hypothetical protein
MEFSKEAGWAHEIGHACVLVEKTNIAIFLKEGRTFTFIEPPDAVCIASAFCAFATHLGYNSFQNTPAAHRDLIRDMPIDSVLSMVLWQAESFTCADPDSALILQRPPTEDDLIAVRQGWDMGHRLAANPDFSTFCESLPKMFCMSSSEAEGFLRGEVPHQLALSLDFEYAI